MSLSKAANGHAATMDPTAHRSSAARPGRSLRQVAIATFIVLFCTLQAGVALWQLGATRPAPFGWQMYAAVPDRPGFVVVLEDGSERTVDPEDVLGKVRGEIDLAAGLPAPLCAATPGAVEVRILDEDGVQRDRRPCS